MTISRVVSTLIGRGCTDPPPITTVRWSHWKLDEYFLRATYTYVYIIQTHPIKAKSKINYAFIHPISERAILPPYYYTKFSNSFQYANVFWQWLYCQNLKTILRTIEGIFHVTKSTNSSKVLFSNVHKLWIFRWNSFCRVSFFYICYFVKTGCFKTKNFKAL